MEKKKIIIPETLGELPQHRNLGIERFGNALIEGRLVPGKVITQAELCDVLGCSISLLRDTLVLLEDYRLVEIKPRLGILIVNPELNFVRESYQFRILIETEALGLFMAEVPDGWVEAVRQRQTVILERLKKNSSDADAVENFIALDYFIHTSFVDKMRNQYISETYQRLQRNIRTFRSFHRAPNFIQKLQTAGREHIDLIDKFASGDKSAAFDSLRRHFEASIFRLIVAS